MNIVIIDGHVLFRQGLSRILSDYPDLKVVNEAGTLREGVAAVCNLNPDIVLMALNLDDQPGIEALHILLDQKSNAKVVVMASSESETSLLDAIRAGARGYILKHSSVQELVASVRAVGRNEVALSRGMATKVIEEYTRLSSTVQADDTCREQLTYREKEILGYLGEGLSNADIGQRLSISQNTVKVHVHNLLEKLQMKSRREAGRFARSNGIVYQNNRLHR